MKTMTMSVAAVCPQEQESAAGWLSECESPLFAMVVLPLHSLVFRFISGDCPVAPRLLFTISVFLQRMEML